MKNKILFTVITFLILVLTSCGGVRITTDYNPYVKSHIVYYPNTLQYYYYGPVQTPFYYYPIPVRPNLHTPSQTKQQPRKKYIHLNTRRN